MEHMNNFPDQLPIAEVLRLAKTSAGQQLISLIQQQSGNEFQQAMQQAAMGDYTRIKRAIEVAMADPQAKKLLKELEG